MKEYKLDFIKSTILLVFTGFLLVTSIHLSLGEVGLQILGVQSISSKKIDTTANAVAVSTTITPVQINQTK